MCRYSVLCCGKKIVDGKLEDDATFCDDWWTGNVSADVRHVEKHFDDMVAKIKSKVSQSKQAKSTVQQQVEENAPGFKTKTRDELMDMSVEERKEYNKQYRTFVSMKEAVEQQQQATRQEVSQAS